MLERLITFGIGWSWAVEQPSGFLHSELSKVASRVSVPGFSSLFLRFSSVFPPFSLSRRSCSPSEQAILGFYWIWRFARASVMTRGSLGEGIARLASRPIWAFSGLGHSRMLKKAGKDIPMKSGTKKNPKSQKEVPGQMLDKASKEIPTTSGTKSQIMMRLEKMVEESDIMHGAIRSVDMDEGVFGIAHSELIAKEDMQQLFEHEELGIAVIHTYIWYMYDTLMRGTELCNRFNFIAASRINTTFITKNPTSVMNELVDRFMVAGDNTTPSLYFLPFNSGNGGHWVLVAIDLSRLMVYYLDSLPGDWSKYPSMKKMVDAAILKFRSKKNYRNRKDITWVRVQCPQQNNSIDCGFFVLRFMRDIIALNRIDIPKMVWNNNLGFILILSDISSNLLLNHEYVLFS
ncbi:hypothetical protein KIW84_014692 [Lathyrus oleraceus]|uniref:Ubiquitin-like protease family profile domain-containing protein n=2 Tax=Pisum sativum TaxID=3888 RepID=A0A9D5BNX5_PEA|nr:hypothetical protein KIW84_014692 [Pisum sativum]